MQVLIQNSRTFWNFIENNKGVKAFIELQGKKKDAAMGLAADVYEYQKLIKELLVELMEENDKYSGPGVDEKE